MGTCTCMHTHTQTHPWSKKSKSSNWYASKRKILISQILQKSLGMPNFWHFALGLGRDEQRPRCRSVSMKIRSSDFFVEYKPLKEKKKKPKSWPLSPKKFIVYLSCLNITLCPIAQPSFLPSPFWGLVFVSFSFLFSIFILLKMSPGPRTLSGADGRQKVLSQSKSLVRFSCTI